MFAQLGKKSYLCAFIDFANVTMKYLCSHILLPLFLCGICIAIFSCSSASSGTNDPDPVDTTDTVTPPDTVPHDTIPRYPREQTGSYARGVDCSWLTEQEADGILFRDSDGVQGECMDILRRIGANAVRLRVWVNHSTGWCNLPDVLVKARRADSLGYRLMIDFHYSDYFCDPSTQTTPAAWTDYSLTQLQMAVRNHTIEVLTALKESNITPEWVQVGNETRNGMLWPTGKLWDENGDLPDGWKNYAALERTGYNAVKTVFPDTKVIVHIDNAYQNNNWFFRKLKTNSGKFDIIGLSHYPMKKLWSGKDWQEMNDLAVSNIQTLYNEFRCPIMLSEIGTYGDYLSEARALQVMQDLLPRLRQMDYFCGVFYWEPQVFNDWKPKEYNAVGWGAYDMGAFTTKGAPNKALRYMLKMTEE